jgi:hypothetical protein
MGPMNREPWQAQDYLEAFRRERPGVGSRERNWQVLERRMTAEPRRARGLQVLDGDAGPELDGSASGSRSARPRERETDVRHPQTDVRVIAIAVATTLAIAAAVLLVIGGIGRGLQAARQHAEPAMQAVDEPTAASPLELVPRRAGPATRVATETDPAAAPASPRSNPDRSGSTTTREPTRTPAASPEPMPAPSSSPEALAEQTRLLARAREALADGNPREALERLDQLGERFPSGALEPERRAYDAIARCRLDPPSADAAARFLADHPASPHVPRVRAACDAVAPTIPARE